MTNGAFHTAESAGITYTEALEEEVFLLRIQLRKKQEHIDALEKQIEHDELENKKLTKIIIDQRRAKYTSKAERAANLVSTSEQICMDLSDVAEKEAEDKPEKKVTVRESVRVIRPAEEKKKSLLAFLNNLEPEETIRRDMPAPLCPECESEMEVVGYQKYRELVVVPARVYAREYEDPVFSCRTCEQTNTKVPMVSSEMSLVRPVPRCTAAAETLAWLVYQKVVLSLPLYRLERFFSEMGVPLSRMTMTNWMDSVCREWLMPLAECMRRELICSSYILHADETPFQVLAEEGRKPQSKGYVWLYCSPYGAAVRYVLMDYQPSRSADCPNAFLEGYHGWMVVDGYSGYRRLTVLNPEIFLSGCWAHARREWYKAVQHAPEESSAWVGWKYVQKLFEMERSYDELTPEERFLARLREIKPMLDEFHEWLIKQYQAQTAFGKAVTYTLNQWSALYSYLSDGRLAAANAAAEIVAKNFAVGRKNFLFSGTSESVRPFMAAYSVAETAKANDLNVYEYFAWIFSRMPYAWHEAAPEVQSRIEAMEEHIEDVFDECLDYLDASIKIPNCPQFPRKKLEAAAVDALREEGLPRFRSQEKNRILAEAKVECARQFLPEHAPPECRRAPNGPNQKPREEKNETA